MEDVIEDDEVYSVIGSKGSGVSLADSQRPFDPSRTPSAICAQLRCATRRFARGRAGASVNDDRVVAVSRRNRLRGLSTDR